MRVLIACEFSGTVRDAFSELGHDAWSCDLLPTTALRPVRCAGDFAECDSCGDLWCDEHGRHYGDCACLGPHKDGAFYSDDCTQGARHIQGDVTEILDDGWDLMIAHPPCTYLASSGLHWNKRRPERQAQTDAALEFVRVLLAAPIPRIAVENPIGCISSQIRKPDQIIHPWQFGDDASKATCLWLKGLPNLMPTNVLPGGRKARRANQTESGQNKLGPSPDRWALRSVTYQGIADAMADQWGNPFQLRASA